MTKNSSGRLALALVLPMAALAPVDRVHAVSFENEAGTVRGSFNSIVSYGLLTRTSGRDCRLLGADNGGCNDAYLNFDDGDRHYDRGQVVSSAIKGVHDLSVKAPDGWSGLLRGLWSYDFAADKVKGGTPLDPEARKAATRDIRFLDAYITKEFEIGNQPARIRLGNQALSWGESVFIAGGINSINAIDLRAAHKPGVQLKEVTTPAPMLHFSSGLGKGFSMEAYYQWRWNAVTFDPSGTFFSSVDYTGKGAQNLYFPSSALAAFGPGLGGDRHTGRPFVAVNSWLNPASASFLDPTLVPGVELQGREKPGNSGQWGFALRHINDGSGDEAAFYYYRYHDKLPSVRAFFSAASNAAVGLGQPDSVRAVYAKDRELFGASYNTRLGDWAVGLEASYRPREAVPVDPTLSPSYIAPNCDLSGTFTDPNGFLGGPFAAPAGDTSCVYALDRKKWQFHLAGINIMSPNGSMGWLLRGLGAAEGTVFAELVTAYYPNLVRGQGIPYAFQADLREPTKTSVAAEVSVSVTYPNAFGSGWAVSPDITWFQGLYGDSASALPGFTKGVGWVGLGSTVDFRMANSLKLRLDYAHNYGGAKTGANPFLDKNYFSAALSVAF